MKTKLLFAACLLFCMAMYPLQAQNGNNSNGSVSYQAEFPVLFVITVDGAELDYITGFLTVHLVDHYVKGIFATERYGVHGVLTSEKTGKTYRISEISLPVNGTLTYWEGDNPWTPEVEEGIWVMDPMGYTMDRLICDDRSVYIIKYTYSLIDLLNGGSGFTNYEIRIAGKN